MIFLGLDWWRCHVFEHHTPSAGALHPLFSDSDPHPYSVSVYMRRTSTAIISHNVQCASMWSLLSKHIRTLYTSWNDILVSVTLVTVYTHW